MGKISLPFAKYLIYAKFKANSHVDKSDVVGAIFGQTEGLLGSDLELRDLQRTGRIGRIEVDIINKEGVSEGVIEISTSLDKVETAIIAAALETVNKIGPSSAEIKIDKIEDVRVSKRVYIKERAKELLKDLVNNILPDSSELINDIEEGLRTLEIREYGNDKLFSGPSIEESDDIIVVEGRADVINLLKAGIKNVIALGGTKIPKTIVDLSKKKTVTLFLDGDRGADIIIKSLLEKGAEIDYIAKAPAGIEVEELSKKEIFKYLKSKIPFEQYRMENLEEINNKNDNTGNIKENKDKKENIEKLKKDETYKKQNKLRNRKNKKELIGTIDEEFKSYFRKFLIDVIGTRTFMLIDENFNIRSQTPMKEIENIPENQEYFAIVIDSIVNERILNSLDNKKINYIVGPSKRVDSDKFKILTVNDLE